MANIQIKSEKLTPFRGKFSIMEQFDSTLSSVIDSTLGLRCRLFGYQYSEIIRSLMSTYFCGGSCVEDVTTHLMNHLSLHPTLRTCSSDTILRANSVMRGRFDARRTLKNLVADLRYFYNRNELYAPAPIQPEDSTRCLVLPHQGVFPRPNRPRS